jgi:hypothetical protein
MMPKVIDEMHDTILKDYINKRIKRSREQKEVSTWIKHKNDTISPVIIRVHPNVNLNKGFNLIGVITSPISISQFDNLVPVSSLFFLLADESEKIVHLS